MGKAKKGSYVVASACMNFGKGKESKMSKTGRITLVVAMVLALGFTAQVAFSQQQPGTQPLPQPRPGMQPSPIKPGSTIQQIKPGPPPTNITVSTTQTTATLAWPAVTGASGYSVYSVGKTGSVPLTPAPVASTSAIHRGLAPGTAYSWTVTALYPDGRQGISPPVSATTKPPVNPTGFMVTTIGNDITLRWNPVPEASFYWLQGSGLPAQKVPPRTTAYTVSGLKVGTLNYALIAYYESGGQSFADEKNPATATITIRPNISGIHFEIEKPVAGTLPPKPSYSRTKISSDGSLTGVSLGPLAGVPDRMWNPGQILSVRMTGGSAFVRSKVRQFAEEWTKYANIRFAFVDDSQPAEIKIDFGSDGFSWSVVGRDALLVPFNFSTMHFGWFDDGTSDTEFSRVVLHEFGHALGLIHEHQSPVAGIQWDKEKVYAFFNARTPPWDRGVVDSQVFARYSVSSTNFSQFDPTSIMEYAFPASLTLNGVGVPGNTTLSATDKQYIKLWYPYPGADVGQLRTNDDCDQINFRVEYGIEAKDKVHFLLRPGSTVTWWKSIQVPIGANQYAELQIQDGGSSDRVIDKVSLDSSRPIRFNKAKEFGIHRLLGYTWDVISALPGGSRVTLDWVNDHCR